MDKNGHMLNLWCRATDNPFEAFCYVCQKRISCKNGGLSQILQHSQGAKHQLKIGVKTGKNQTKFSWLEKTSVNVVDGPNTTNQASTHCHILSSTSRQLPTSGPPSHVEQPSPVTKKPFVLVTNVDMKTRAEALWAMKVACSNYSFSSCNSIGNLFRVMFPDSAVAKDFAMESVKTSYIISHGLRPYFTKLLVKSMEGVYFTLQFDETTTTQIKKQMDLLVRFWSDKSNRVEVRFLRAIMFGHSFASNVSRRILDNIQELSLDVRKLLSLSCDGPNVNISIRQKINTSLADIGAKPLVDAGFCSIHVVHNAFRQGLLAFGTHAEDFCIDVYHHFKLSAARREDFHTIQFELGLDESVFLRHVQCRWLTLLPALDRITSQLDALKAFFCKDDSSSDDSGRCQRIRRALHSSNIDRLEVHLLFLQSIKPLFDTFLRIFQNEGPLIHCLYASFVELIRSVLVRFMKAQVLKGITGRQLADLDVKKVENFLPLNVMEVRSLLQKKLITMNPDIAKKHLLSARAFYSAVAIHLISKLPLHNILLEALSCLHPLLRKSAKGMRYIKVVAEKMPCIEDKELAGISDEWRLYMDEDIITETWYRSEDTFCRIDDYWSRVFEIKNAANLQKYPLLSRTIKCALTLAHSNADTERSLSINKRMLTSERTPMADETINGNRIIKDAVKHAGGQPSHVEITRELISSCRAAYSAFSAMHKEEKKREKKRLEEKECAVRSHEEDEKKKQEHDKQLKSLSEQKSQLMKEEKESEENLNVANSMLNEAQARLEDSLKQKNFKESTVAMELLGAAKRRFEESQNSLKCISSKRLKIMQSYEKAAKRNK